LFLGNAVDHELVDFTQKGGWSKIDKSLPLLSPDRKFWEVGGFVNSGYYFSRVAVELLKVGKQFLINASDSFDRFVHLDPRTQDCHDFENVPSEVGA
jgi:hypothetical protein